MPVATRSRQAFPTSPAVAAACVLLLASTSQLRAAPNAAEKAALKQLAGRSFEARVAALEKLKASRDPAVVTEVAARLKDPDATVRWAAVETLEAMGAVTALEALREAARDPSPLVANRARAALGVLDGSAGAAKVGTSLAVGIHDARATPQDVMVKALRSGVDEGLAQAPRAAAAAQASHDASFQVVGLSEKTAGNTVVLEVTCTATVSQLPARALRFATRVAAAVEFPAAAPPSARAEALADAVRAAGVGLGQEVAEWASRAP